LVSGTAWPWTSSCSQPSAVEAAMWGPDPNSRHFSTQPASRSRPWFPLVRQSASLRPSLD